MKTNRFWVLCFIFVSFLCLLPSLGEAIDCSVESLQAAIDAAENGNTITVSGTCDENVYIREAKFGITLKGGGAATINGPDSTTATVTIEGRNNTVKGFTITGGLDGIQVLRGGTAIIDGNTIRNTGRRGIGITENSFAGVINCKIQKNLEHGIYVNESSSARIGFLSAQDTEARPNTIRNNGSNGILVNRSSIARIVGNIISNNKVDGIGVVKGSQADISDNTININSNTGIFVSQNSGVNLGNDAGTTIFDLPNSTTVKNGQVGIKCSLGAYADGRIGTLNGTNKAKQFDSTCIDSMIP